MSRIRTQILPYLLVLLFVHSVSAQTPRGDVDFNGNLQITDAVRILNHLFVQARPDFPCDALADTNADGSVNISDPILVLTHLFLGGEPPGFLSPFDERVCLPAETQDVEEGMTVFENPDPQGNTFACETCHSLVPDRISELRRPGHSLNDALGRGFYKNGELEYFVDAVNICREDWMRTDPFEDDDPRFLDLVSLLREFGETTPTDPLEFEIVEPEIEGPSTADPDQGCTLFHTSCVVCHGEGAQGTERAPPLFFDPNRGLDADYVRQRIRTSGRPNDVYPGLTGGVMPFWSASRLSDEEVESLVAYVSSRPVSQCVEVEPPPEEIVLRSGEFVTISNRVAGEVEELGSGRVRIRGFHFDGLGDDVRVWLYQEEDVDGGVSIGRNLVREGGWNDEEIVADLPPGVSMDDFSYVAVRSTEDGALFATCELEDVEKEGEGNVLRSGELITRFHDVQGTVEELDTRKIRVRNFVFDGAGIDVRVWLYQQENPQGGYEIGPNLLRPFPGWAGETIVVDVPEAITSDMYDAVSIWCVPVRVSFGDTVLRP
ncbi:MAG: DM13 domain-containing protein [Planctomycetota bacterium]